MRILISQNINVSEDYKMNDIVDFILMLDDITVYTRQSYNGDNPYTTDISYIEKFNGKEVFGKIISKSLSKDCYFIELNIDQLERHLKLKKVNKNK